MKRLFVVVLMTCLAIAVGGTLIAHAGQPIMLSSYIYDGNMARYFDVDMDDLSQKPEVSCVVMSEVRTPTDMRFRTQIGNWRILADWPANTDQCNVMIWQEPPGK